jgi:Tat protein secretion system quality control protein TatD with DNase activity
MFKYFTKNNTYRYFDVIDKLLTSYNFVHSTICMHPSKVNPSNIYSVWKKMNSLRAKIPQGRVKFKAGA